MLIVHGRNYSSNVQIVMWAIGELGLRFERRDAGHRFGGLETPEFLAMNPMGRIPVLRDGDLTLFESAAILRYLAARYGDAEFWPADPTARAGLDSWAEWAKHSFAPVVNQIYKAQVVADPAGYDPARVAPLAAEAGRLALMLDARIGNGPWLAGEPFTFADIAAGHGLWRYFGLDFARPETPNLSAYHARLKDRPAYREHAMISWEPHRFGA